MSVIPPLAKLYLRQFFCNFFYEQERKEELHAFTSGLEVLQEKLANFQQKQLAYVDKIVSKSDSGGVPMPSVIVPPQEVEEGCGLNVRFQNIYDRIRSLMQVEEIILERLTFEAKRVETASRQVSRITEVIPENELYELISEFRERNKDLENKNQQLRKQLQQVTREISLIKEQLTTAAQTKISLKNELNRQQEKIFQMQKKISQKDVQLNQLLASKVDLLQSVQGKDKVISDLEESLAAKIMETNRLKESAITQAHKMNRFNQLIDIKMTELRKELMTEIKASVSNKENHNRAALGMLKSIFNPQSKEV